MAKRILMRWEANQIKEISELPLDALENFELNLETRANELQLESLRSVKKRFKSNFKKALVPIMKTLKDKIRIRQLEQELSQSHQLISQRDQLISQRDQQLSQRENQLLQSQQEFAAFIIQNWPHLEMPASNSSKTILRKNG